MKTSSTCTPSKPCAICLGGGEGCSAFNRRPPKKTTIKAITLHRPWGRFVASGEKPIENRSWTPPKALLGKWIAIHAGKFWDQKGAARLRVLLEGAPLELSDHPEGVIGVAKLAGWCDAEGTVIAGVEKLTDLDRRFLFGPFGWILRDPLVLEAVIPCSGHQGLWHLDEETHRKVFGAIYRRELARGVAPVWPVPVA